jgi:uncharacterized peroxidase-related enzyme
MFLKAIAEHEASGPIAVIYAHEKEKFGFVMEATSCMTARADLLPLWEDFYGKIKAGFSLSPRDWRLITFIAAKHVPSTYCATVYGKQLLQDLGGRPAVLALLHDYREAGLSARDVAMLEFAETVARHASKVTQATIDKLRGVGFSDPQISDIALCASLRCFMSRFYDAMGAGPEAAFLDEDPNFRAELAVGRPLVRSA